MGWLAANLLGMQPGAAPGMEPLSKLEMLLRAVGNGWAGGEPSVRQQSDLMDFLLEHFH